MSTGTSVSAVLRERGAASWAAGVPSAAVPLGRRNTMVTWAH